MAYIRPPSMDERLEKDYLAAAHWATLREKAVEEAAAGYNISTDEYLAAMDLNASTMFQARPALMDAMEADYMHAFIIADTREAKRRESVEDNTSRADKWALRCMMA
ncbi:hypothetical protein EMIHUDRAFT_433729 [Emiliania huxleyi CCMP1516]|uniref:Uncharacterized protein n=2 Tax=Emiliania huxleyi TaxID=2903 RepID=A0A0D3KM86_EMIH1|nr:hypothetical protein EMIHUDRAFT_433729 [Emiliania huxleyi CCMP1516]EOD36871.1 hypothetical protein EMIHUDRAFT_433729 [Emiliania huxleyi CCMP1516]|eukprot:XP_005789300.1 hypothetical protein EMIHUDRAFT_433729 [Emiliania huxleyi CCMP1516]